MKKLLVPCLLVLLLSYVLFKALEIPSLPVSGWVEEGWEELREAYQELVDSGLEKGSSFAVHLRGRLVAHLWAGCKNFFCTDVWRTDTTVLMHSSTHLLGAVCLAVMADRGRLNYSERVAAYWPEFAANGKAAVTVEQLLSHRAGLIGVEPGLTLEELKEGGPLVGQRLAEQRPAWEPGSQVHYHPMSLGLYMDELFRRVDPKARSCATFLEREVVPPLGLDLKVGLRDASQANRFAWPYCFSNLRLLLRPLLSDDSAPRRVLAAFFTHRNDTYRKAMSPLGRSLFAYSFQLRELRALPLMASNGVATADSLARLLGALVAPSGGRFPHRLLASPRVLAELQEPLANVSWMSAAGELLLGRGPALMSAPDGSRMLGFPGTGGQMAFAVPAKRLGWAYLTNHLSPYSMGGDPRPRRLLQALFRLLAKERQGGGE